MSAVFLRRIGLAAPSLNGWANSLPVLRGTEPFVQSAMASYKPQLLAANERRRTTSTIKLALQVAEQVLFDEVGNKLPYSFASVFASSDGDTEITEKICTALSMTDRPVSPTQFHNSVHNAPAGYWAIAAGSREPSCSISAFDASFSAGLVEAITFVRVEQQPVLLVAYDSQPPETLYGICPTQLPFAVSLLLEPALTKESTHVLQLHLHESVNIDSCTDPELEALRKANPIARCLPLLQQLASLEKGIVHLPYVRNKTVGIEVTPC
jgi:hypothetical protein